MKTREGETMSCPYCGRKDKLRVVGDELLAHPNIPYAIRGRWDYIACDACSRHFMITRINPTP